MLVLIIVTYIGKCYCNIVASFIACILLQFTVKITSAEDSFAFCKSCFKFTILYSEPACYVWTTVPGSGPFFSMSIWNLTTVMYSDWGLRQVASYNVDSGSLSVLVRDLTRPAGVVVSHSERIEGRKKRLHVFFRRRSKY